VYNNFFGFRERPFQLVPNPDYLFMSRSHEEAMAHLRYALSHGEGFVELTGEVGTGKTTLCRAFLEDLEREAEIAYIFNPRLNAVELLKAINDEFGIDSGADNIKDLIDTLNVFLMEKKAENKSTILLIDEAQNLSKEVLEQLRLLSNLETTSSKLLQIILVGQPELRTKLDSYELRQLRQRITLSWYLTPLSRMETREYIRHRINIASQKTGDKFTDSAYDQIYKYSGGIPRLINIACDRALLTAFGFNRRKVTGSIAGGAIQELASRGGVSKGIFTRNRMIAAIVVLVCLALVSFAGMQIFKTESPGTKTSAVTSAGADPVSSNRAGESEESEDSAVDRAPVPRTAPADGTGGLESFLGRLEGRSSRLAAFSSTAALWKTPVVVSPQLNDLDNSADFFRLASAHNDFLLLPVENDFDLIAKLNLPAVLEFLLPGSSEPRFLTLAGVSGNELVLKGGEKGEAIHVAAGDIVSYWSGFAFVPWKDFLNFMGTIPGDAPPEAVFTLKMLLKEIGFSEIKPDQTYDDAAVEAVKTIQQKHGIVVDGIVGSKTKIVIYNEKKDLFIPHLRPVTADGGGKTDKNNTNINSNINSNRSSGN
jgi:general secretion pathway protein A